MRTVFKLPSSALHELAVVLFNVWPAEIVMLHRRLRFLASVQVHDFPFLRDAALLDVEFLRNLPKSWSSGTFRLLRRYDPDFSTADGNLLHSLQTVLSSLGDRTVFNYFYIKHGDSESLSFFRLLGSPESLSSFRSLLKILPWDQSRLLILFCSSLLRFCFCPSPCATCPLCRKQWLWEHFFTCPRLLLVPSIPSSPTICLFKASVRSRNWSDVLCHIRFCLHEWVNVLPDALLSTDLIDELRL